LQDGPFTWSEPEQSVVLGSYFWGYLLTQVPGGRVADLFGGKWVFFAAVVLHIVPTLLSPVCSAAGYQYLIIMRVVEGLGGGVTFPAMNALVSKWAPPQERSSITSICLGGKDLVRGCKGHLSDDALILVGTALGTVLSISSAGLIADLMGWEGVFYLHGGLSLVWCVMWVALVTNSPEDHPFISEAERDYIMGAAKASGTGEVPALFTLEERT
jgi:MFS family permease